MPRRVGPPKPKRRAQASVDPDARLALRGARGRPRRAPGLAKTHRFRIDDEAYETLKAEFGSIGNALYYLFEGIKEFRASHGLDSPRPASLGKGLKRERFLGLAEIDLLIVALEDHIANWEMDGRQSRPIRSLITKLENAIRRY